MLDQARLSIFHNLFRSVADEMGVTIERTSASPNMKERLDFSCALFSCSGEMIAQAAHIPVHLGAMPLSVAAALQRFSEWEPGDVVILNDPYMGGTHLPDITMISPIFYEGRPVAFAACRAHHSDIGGSTPGSMPLATDIYQEGLRIPPVRLYRRGELQQEMMDLILANVRVPHERKADLAAQAAALRRAALRMDEICAKYGLKQVEEQMDALLGYTERLMRERIRGIPNGSYTFTDYLDDDGFGTRTIPIHVTVRIDDDHTVVDFTGTAPQVTGPVNCVFAVTLSAVLYCFQALLPSDTPVNGGTLRALTLVAPEGSLVNARHPAPVAAGNVETSQRIVDVVLGALAQALPDVIPAASCGTMNNLALGGITDDGKPFSYYETMGGGMGAHGAGPGLSGIQTHMTNTKNTPIEALETAYPLRVHRYALRKGSGGAGHFRGGEGLIREIEMLQPCDATLLTERRLIAPYGLHGGEPGSVGANWLYADGVWHKLAPKVHLRLKAGQRLRIETPGGGGYGRV